MITLALAAGLVLFLLARNEQRSILAARHRLLDEAIALMTPGFRSGLSPDEHPVLGGTLRDGRQTTLDLISDTMVTRRLPQLWLRVTIHLDMPRSWPCLGVLARPTGSEYYALVHSLDTWIEPPPSAQSLLMRGDAEARDVRWEPFRKGLTALVANPKVKEVAVTPRMIRVVFQAAEGERGAHLVLRQARFAMETVPEATIGQALDVAAAISSLSVPSAELSPATAA